MPARCAAAAAVYVTVNPIGSRFQRKITVVRLVQYSGCAVHYLFVIYLFIRIFCLYLNYEQFGGRTFLFLFGILKLPWMENAAKPFLSAWNGGLTGLTSVGGSLSAVLVML